MALIYAAFAALWIVASGALLVIAVTDPVVLGRIELAKGLIFVAVTSVLLYLLLRVWDATNIQDAEHRPIGTRRLLLIFAALALVLPLLGFVITGLYVPQIEREAYANLAAIARLKAEQIENWLDERRGDSKVLAGDDAFVAQVDQFARQEQRAELSRPILDRFEHLLINYHYTKILLLSTSGRVLLSSGEDVTTAPVLPSLLREALASKQVQRRDIYRDDEGHIHVEWVVPLLVSDAQGERAVAVVVLRITAQHFIFPLIQTWPTASASGETLLVRREDESVMFLNELRHRQDTALGLALPLADTDLPAAVAVRSAKLGTTQGKDYRGVAVLAAYRPVAGTNWHIVAKFDRDEALAPLRGLVLGLSMIALAAIAAVSAAVLLLWRQQQRAYQVELHARSMAALEESERRYRAVAQSANDAIVTADSAGKIVDWNPSAARLFGYTETEILGQAMTILMPERFRERSRAGLARVVSGGEQRIIGKTVELAGRRKDGAEFPLEISLAQWKTAAGRFFSATIRDITARKHADEALRTAEEQFRGLVEQSLAGIYIIQDGRFAYVNPRFAEIFGYASAGELLGVDGLSVVAEPDRGIVAENMRSRLDGEVDTVSYGFTGVRKDGAMVEVGVHGARATHEGRPAIIGLLQDISEKTRAEEQIQRYLAQLETAFMSTVEVATTLSEMRDPYTAGHERRVGKIAVAIGAELGFDDRRNEGLRVAGYLHDIGKITIPAEILSKPGRLSALEFQLIQGHPQASYDVLKDVRFPWPVAQVALQHHERIDGSGYPRGLTGGAILLEARIMAVADVVEAMSAHRPYRPGLGIDRALAEIERGRGSAYDTQVADACLKLFRERRYRLPA